MSPMLRSHSQRQESEEDENSQHQHSLSNLWSNKDIASMLLQLKEARDDWSFDGNSGFMEPIWDAIAASLRDDKIDHQECKDKFADLVKQFDEIKTIRDEFGVEWREGSNRLHANLMIYPHYAINLVFSWYKVIEALLTEASPTPESPTLIEGEVEIAGLHQPEQDHYEDNISQNPTSIVGNWLADQEMRDNVYDGPEQPFAISVSSGSITDEGMTELIEQDDDESQIDNNGSKAATLLAYNNDNDGQSHHSAAAPNPANRPNLTPQDIFEASAWDQAMIRVQTDPYLTEEGIAAMIELMSGSEATARAYMIFKTDRQRGHWLRRRLERYMGTLEGMRIEHLWIDGDQVL